METRFFSRCVTRQTGRIHTVWTVVVEFVSHLHSTCRIDVNGGDAVVDLYQVKLLSYIGLWNIQISKSWGFFFSKLIQKVKHIFTCTFISHIQVFQVSHSFNLDDYNIQLKKTHFSFSEN